MKPSNGAGLLLILLLSLTGCSGQTNSIQNQPSAKENDQGKIVGGGCDGCELMYIGLPATIQAIDTSAGWQEKGQKLMITGTVFQIGGKMPASGVIIYYWQTDNNGYYSPRQGMDDRAKRHGHIRGWVKTDANGKYTIYTIRPAPYPNEAIPAHIHLSVKEPDIEEEYYTDEINFDDDELLIPYFKKYPQENRGGSGVVRVLVNRDLQIAQHNLVLGLNIPNYPKRPNKVIGSGLNIGEDQPSFIPFHAFGPDKGTQTCPVCKYGRYHGIIYFVGNNPSWEEIKHWLTFLEAESIKRKKYLKAYFVYGNENHFSQESRRHELEQIGKELNLEYIALTFVPSFADKTTEVYLNNINKTVENTFIIYRNRNIIDKYINLKPTEENFNILSVTLDKTTGDYFDLPELKHD